MKLVQLLTQQSFTAALQVGLEAALSESLFLRLA